MYNTLTGELQTPLAYLTMVEADKDFETLLLEDKLLPSVSSGVQSLGASAVANNMLQYAQMLTAIAPALQLDNHADPQKFYAALRAACNLTDEQTCLSEEQIRANQAAAEAQQQAEMQQQAALNVADQSETIQTALGG